MSQIGTIIKIIETYQYICVTLMPVSLHNRINKL